MPYVMLALSPMRGTKAMDMVDIAVMSRCLCSSIKTEREFGYSVRCVWLCAVWGGALFWKSAGL